jgi:3-dehydroquinate synthetase
MGLLHQSVVERVESVLERFGLPTKLPDPGPCGTDSQATSLVASQLAGPVGRMTDKVMGAIRHDKKVRGGAQQFVLLEGVGRPTIRSDIPERAVREAYESLLR